MRLLPGVLYGAYLRTTPGLSGASLACYFSTGCKAISVPPMERKSLCAFSIFVGMELRETLLPGFGKKYTLTLATGEKITVIVYQNGQRELYLTEKGEEDPSYSVRLTDEEARELAFVLGGVRYQPLPSDKMNLIFRELVVEWIPVAAACPMAGKTLSDLAVRRLTGASVLAILRGETIIPTPDPYQEVIQPGDTLVVVGTRPQIEKVLPLCRPQT
jgi:TrkA domain protein